jgi:hypothetical protein
MMPMMNGTVPISEVAADAVVTTQATNGQDTLEECEQPAECRQAGIDFEGPARLVLFQVPPRLPFPA